MIKILNLGLFFTFTFCLNLYSQIEYMPVEAKLNGDSWGFFYNGSFTKTAEKDTLCGSIPCRKIVIVEKDNSTNKIASYTYFSKQEKDSIFFWNQTLQKFEFEFRTNMSVGDSIRYKFFSNSFGDTTTTLYADSIKLINSMRITKCHVICPNYISGGIPTRIEFSIYDRYGLVDNYSPAFFCNIGSYDGIRHIPICYQDKQIFFTTSAYNGSNCGLTVVTNDIKDIDISLSPNPVQSYLDISTNENALIRECSLVNSLGHIVQKTAFENVKTAHLFLNKMLDGVYFLKITTSLSQTVVKKIVIAQ